MGVVRGVQQWTKIDELSSRIVQRMVHSAPMVNTQESMGMRGRKSFSLASRESRHLRGCKEIRSPLVNEGKGQTHSESLDSSSSKIEKLKVSVGPGRDSVDRKDSSGSSTDDSLMTELVSSSLRSVPNGLLLSSLWGFRREKRKDSDDEVSIPS